MSESKQSNGDEKAVPAVPELLAVRAPVARKMLGGVSETAFWSWVRRGEIEVVRVGHITLVPIAGLHDFLERNTVRAASVETTDE